MLGQLLQQIFEILVWLQVIRFGSFSYAVGNGTALCSAARINQIPILPAQSKGANTLLRSIVLSSGTAPSVRKYPQKRFLIDAVADCPASLHFWRYVTLLVFQIRKECGNQWGNVSFSLFQTLFGRHIRITLLIPEHGLYNLERLIADGLLNGPFFLTGRLHTSAKSLLAWDQHPAIVRSFRSLAIEWYTSYPSVTQMPLQSFRNCLG